MCYHRLLEYYQRIVASGEILEDAQQVAAIQKLQSIYDSLQTPKSIWRPFTPNVSKGLYLWGNVGIGKTFLIDTFYHYLPFEQKWRTHFLPFMQEVHTQLRMLQGIKNPLQHIAKKWAKKIRIICFDELIVNDIADACLLGHLIDAFFKHGICVIFTSNFAPDDLYKNGIQRALFLPTIAKIKTYTEVIHLTTLKDYRTRHSNHPIAYYWYPLTTVTQQNMETTFHILTENVVPSTAPLMIYNREIKVKKTAGRVAWFEFLTICGIPRNQDDYLAIAQTFHTIFISNLVPILANKHDLARNFIQLIDVLYAAKIRLVISAALPIEQLYTEGKLLFEFNRTRSRLRQMQSVEWASST